MTETRYNTKNKLYITVDYDNNTVKFYDLEHNEIPVQSEGWKWQHNYHIYPCIKVPYTGKLMSCHKLVAYTFNREQFDQRIKENVSNGLGYVKMVIDHIDNNPLNYMPTNLRFCTQAENLHYRHNQPAYHQGEH